MPVDPSRQAMPYVELVSDQNAKQSLRLAWQQIHVLKVQAGALLRGSLYPDQRPQLTAQDVGSLYYAEDFARFYRWNGTAWQDEDATPARMQISFFFNPPNPSIGWVQCNGQRVRLSRPDGSTEPLDTPNLPPYHGFAAWMRV